MLVKPTLGPSPVSQLLDSKGNDISDKILPYLGPNYDWHKQKVTPDLLGYKRIIFLFLDDSVLSYSYKNELDTIVRMTEIIARDKEENELSDSNG